MSELTLSEAGVILTDYLVVSIMKPDYRVRSLADMPSFVARSLPSRPRIKVILRDERIRIPLDKQRAESALVFDLVQERMKDKRPETSRDCEEQEFDFHRLMCKAYKTLNRSSINQGVLGAVGMFQFATIELSTLVKLHMRRDRGIFELTLEDNTANGYWSNGQESGLFSLTVSEDHFSVSRLMDMGRGGFVEELSAEFARRWPYLPEVNFTFMTAHAARTLRDDIAKATSPEKYEAAQ